MVLIFCLRIRMLRLSEGLILHVRRHEIVWKYIWTYSRTEEAELWQSRQSRSTFTSLEMKADLKCETTDLLQSMQKGSVEAELPIFGNEGRVLVEKPIFRSLAVKTERKCRSETANLGSPGRDEMRKRNFISLEVLAEQVRKAELQIFASKGRAEAREQNFTYLAVKAERKCGYGSETSHFWQSMQNESADVELQIFASQGRAEMWKRKIRSLAVKAEQKCGSGISDL